MSRNHLYRVLISLLLILSFALTACGGGASAPVAEEAPPAAEQQEAAPTEPAAEEAAPEEEATEEAPAEEAAADETAAEDEAANLEATAEAQEAEAQPAEEEPAAEAPAGVATEGPVFDAVDAYLTTIPEGFMSVGGLDAFKEMMDATDVYLIDVRTESEYEGGHIGNAINIPLRTLAQNLDKIPTDQPVVVYCASGHRAGMATTSLRTLGYDNVRAFPAGYNGWSAAGEEASTEAGEAGSFEVPEIDPAVLEAVDSFLTNIPEGFYAIGAVDRLQEMMDAGAMTLIDVREEGELADGVIPGAISIPIRTLSQNLDQIPTDQSVVTYCASGFRAALSAAALHILGYDNVRAFPPSFRGWVDAGGEVQPLE